MKSKQEERREQWRQRIAQQERTSQPIRAFCRERGVNEHMFYAWRQRLRSENAPVTFALIDSRPSAMPSTEPIEVMLASGDRLRIPTDAATLRLVLNVLREQRA